MQLSIRSKIIALCTLPVLLFSVVITVILAVFPDPSAQSKAGEARSVLMAERMRRLEHSLQVARAAIEPIYAASSVADHHERDRAVALLREMSRSTPDQFFGFNSEGDRIFSIANAQEGFGAVEQLRLPGNRVATLRLINAALDHSGFYEYKVSVPGNDQSASWMGHTIYLEKWDLVLGNAINVDDVDAQVAKVSELLVGPSRVRLEQIVAMGTLCAVLLAGFTAYFVAELLSPLSRMREVLDEIAQGSGDFSRMIEIKRHDEIGAVSQSFNEFSKKAGQQLNDVISAVQSMLSLVRASTPATKITHPNYSFKPGKPSGAPQLYVVAQNTNQHEKQTQASAQMDYSHSPEGLSPTVAPLNDGAEVEDLTAEEIAAREEIISLLKTITKNLNETVDKFQV